MKKLIEKIIGSQVFAKHTAIKGRKSEGAEDTSSYSNWKKGSFFGGDVN